MVVVVVEVAVDGGAVCAREPFIINQGQVCRVFCVCQRRAGGGLIPTTTTVTAADDITQRAPGLNIFFRFISFRPFSLTHSFSLTLSLACMWWFSIPQPPWLTHILHTTTDLYPSSPSHNCTGYVRFAAVARTRGLQILLAAARIFCTEAVVSASQRLFVLNP